VEVGPFVTGDKSILFGWAQQTHDSMCNKKTFGDLLKIIATEPVRERDIQDSKTFFHQLQRKEGTLKSVWSGKTITHFDEKALDHMIPFSVWKNNEFWNILPVLKTENQTKSDFIPHPDLLVRQKEHIIEYWNKMNESDTDVFMEQIRYSLIGKDADAANWQEQAFSSLHKKCRYLVDVLGYQSWSSP
jgi:CRISPR/Cas system Type II protein with McrA/HNH and RuvC-like nuclease domain